jgi:hypothetical protein
MLDRKAQIVKGKNTLIRNALYRDWVFQLASEIVFMQSQSSFAKTPGEFAL